MEMDNTNIFIKPITTEKQIKGSITYYFYFDKLIKKISIESKGEERGEDRWEILNTWNNPLAILRLWVVNEKHNLWLLKLYKV